MLRLFVLETAWKIDNTSTQETRTDIAGEVHDGQGAARRRSTPCTSSVAGTTDLTPIQAMYAAAPTMGIADGVDEVHKATVARNVLKATARTRATGRPSTSRPRRGGVAEVRAPVRGRPRPRTLAEGYKKYFASRG
jgi:hypothetical protein